MFTKNGFNQSICYFIFKGIKFFTCWHDLSMLKKRCCGCFWYSLNELINTILYFFVSFVKTGLFWFSILWTFGYELTKLLIINNIKVSCNNMTVTLRESAQMSSLFWSIFSCIWTEYRDWRSKSRYSIQKQGKIRTRKKSYLDTFHAV